ncbi:MAG: response regulator transcription factor [Prolixibacteraceae bacterium]|nr:response regulator transcription factor [Prolixibacteraceae bacterium]MBT6006314.1 response regulator transcription factor [Prolixibacteraceae bacterium]MBT6765229.1 response regulator transcription factor [Prolixibacteraceae bacterium]MBT6998041.1 response regulator transcription factor [Prolixibacteraceae bacterium]MBT7396156.1 response regulator transcription factor [Prolixibacteraceae bacterium]
MKILIVDDHPIIRNGIKQIILDISQSNLVDEAEETQEAVQKAVQNNYDLIIMDISMPGGGGLEALGQIKKIKPQARVLILSIYNNEQYISRAMKAGASGYLTKTSATDELHLAIKKIISGGKYFSSEVAQKLAHIFDSDHNKQKHSNLSEREFQIFCMLALGKSINEIGEELFLSPKTISTHYYRILNKMGMKKNSEIIHYAVKHSLIDVQ